MENNGNLSALENQLAEIEKEFKTLITAALEMVKKDSSIEKEVLNMFVTPTMRIYDFFMKETERTGTESVGKNVFKYAMFKKF